MKFMVNVITPSERIKFNKKNIKLVKQERGQGESHYLILEGDF